MINKMDKKTYIFSSGIIMFAILLCLISSLSGSPLSQILQILIIALSATLVLFQINLDKNYMATLIHRHKRDRQHESASATESLTKIFENLDLLQRNLEIGNLNTIESVDKSLSTVRHELYSRVTYESSYRDKVMTDLLKGSINNSDIRVRSGIEELKASMDALKLEFINLKKNQFFEENKEMSNPVSLPSVMREDKNTPTLYGRGAALVPTDPARETKLFQKMNTKIVYKFILIGSESLHSYLEQGYSDCIVINPSTALAYLDQPIPDKAAEIQQVPVLIMEPAAFEQGLWAATLTSAGLKQFTMLTRLVTRVRELEGFSFLVGEIRSPSTFSTSLSQMVDVHVTQEEFQDDWAFDAQLKIPRQLQAYVVSKENTNNGS